MTSTALPPLQWDIFCAVVDNYGDIGVTWRLARQLVHDHGQRVRLWVDDLQALAQICPPAQSQLDRQPLEGVAVHHWTAAARLTAPSEVVVEAFGCRLAPALTQDIQRLQPLWLNLEYLSAEAWTEDCHGLPSPQPGGLAKYFFFPGFSTATGGLLREQGLMERRQAFQADAQAQKAFLARLGVEHRADERLLSLFSYENPNLADCLNVLAESLQTSLLLVPEGRILGDLSAWAGAPLGRGDCWQQGQLRVQVLPFLSQPDYDLLLWCCDLNLVRGEDSFVRAQWAGRPFIWHIYSQEEQAHLAKLAAFLARYLAGLPAAAADACQALWQSWNGGASNASAWRHWLSQTAVLQAHAERWCQGLARQQDLAGQLLRFALAHQQPAQPAGHASLSPRN